MRVHLEAAVDEVLDGVGDFELAASRRLDLVDRVEDVLVEHINADQGQIAFRLLGFFFEAQDAAAARRQLGDAELLRMGHFGQQDLRGAAELAELVDQAFDAAGDQVVAQVHDEGIVPQEVLGNLHGVGEAERGLLLDVGDLGAEAGAVADRGADFVAGIAHHDADFFDAGGHDRLDTEKEDRLVGDRHELFCRGIGQRPEPRTFASGQDETFHVGFPSKFLSPRRRGPCGRQATAADQKESLRSRKVPTFLSVNEKR